MKRALCLIIVIFSFLLVGCNKTSKTIEEITGVSLDDISYIKTGNNVDNDYDVDTFIEEYKDLKFTKTSGNIGNTARKYYVCYNSDNEVLFTLVDIGNQDKFFIKKGFFDIEKDSKKFQYKLEQ